MYNNERRIICITGADGSGKSTLVDGIKKECPQAYEVSIWDMLANPAAKIFTSKKDIDDYLCLLSADARLLFLAHAMEAAMDMALRSDAPLLLINAYYYKYFSAEVLMGANPALEKQLAGRMPVPDKTIYLHHAPALSAARKTRFSKYECGCREATAANFIDFQNKVVMEFERYIQPDWYLLDASHDVPTLSSMAIQFISPC
ncbi:hypothetical protein [Chitinophaga sp.]|uniref:hypothetical protein n=1 Tax=Chitinophaga sp. TaxID=1869181 RepID=UPI0031D54C83